MCSDTLDVSYSLGEQDWIDWYCSEIGTSTQHRRGRVVALLISFVISAVAIVPTWIAGYPLGPLHYGLCATAALAIIWMEWWWRYGPSRAMRKDLRGEGGHGKLGQYQMCATHEKIEWQTPLWGMWTAWEMVSEIRCSARFATITIARNGDLLIPAGAFGSNAEFRSFVDTLTSMRGAARSFERRCMRCGYDLQGATSLGCSECGWQR